MKDPEIVEMEAKNLAGISIHTSLADDKTELLWKRFMNRKKDIANPASNDLYSVQVYDEGFIKGHFNSQSIFEKWAAIEVNNLSALPEGLKSLGLSGGLYAVFTHQGTAQQFAETANFIFAKWIPSSQYTLDDRPHFEVLGNDYLGPDNPDSKEKIWIPIKKK